MKRIFLTLLVCCLSAAIFAQSMKIVVNRNNEPIGRYVKTNANTYTVLAQDDEDVPIAGHKVVTYNAADGQGVIFMKDFGKVNVRQEPNTSSPIVAKIRLEEGEMPDAYPCLGLTNGWYKTEIDGITGYIRADLMEWDGICTF